LKNILNPVPGMLSGINGNFSKKFRSGPKNHLDKSMRVRRTKQSFTLFKDYLVTLVMTPDNFWGAFGLFRCNHNTRSGQMEPPLKSWNGIYEGDYNSFQT